MQLERLLCGCFGGLALVWRPGEQCHVWQCEDCGACEVADVIGQLDVGGLILALDRLSMMLIRRRARVSPDRSALHTSDLVASARDWSQALSDPYRLLLRRAVLTAQRLGAAQGSSLLPESLRRALLLLDAWARPNSADVLWREVA